MGRALLASDVEAGPKDPVASLIFREQFSSASTSGPQSDSWKIPFEVGLPIHNGTVFTGQHNVAGPSWATNQHHVGYESWRERDKRFPLDVDSEVTGLATKPYRITMPSRFEVSVQRVLVVSGPWASVNTTARKRLRATRELLARYKYPTPRDRFPVARFTTPPKVSHGKLASEFQDFLGLSRRRQNVIDQYNVLMSHYCVNLSKESPCVFWS